MRKLLWTATCLLPLKALATMQVALTPSVASPQAVGTPVTLTAAATDTNPGTLSYRYTVTHGGASHIVRDYSQANTLAWAGVVADGLYAVQVTVRNNSTQETTSKGVLYRFTSLASGSTPVVSATANPLVALFSVPPCATGSRMRVQFGTNGKVPDTTDWRACDGSTSMNVYIAGMLQNTRYAMAAQILDASGVTTGQPVYYKTGAAPSTLPQVTAVVPANTQSDLTDDLLLSDFIAIGPFAGYPTATDLNGRPLWYYAAFLDPSQAGGLLVRDLAGGTMLVLANGPNSSTATLQTQILREIDLAGNALRETNATRIQEQIAAMGLTSDCRIGGSICVFTSFHHDAIRLPNGHTLAFGIEEKMYPAGTQGATAPVDILGDVVVELDDDFQVVWYWDSYSHMDINRAALLGETCVPGNGACPPLFLAAIANDWLHGNSIQYTAADHDVMLSFRHQDWVVKIDFRDGSGDGSIVWRLGAGGDFSLVASDPSPWFSHQHDAGFESNGTLTLFDDGNTRVAQNPGVVENSRGQAYLVDENNRVATLILNADLGVYSAALGSAQLLANGNYHFLPGYNNPGPSQFSQSIEVLPTGVTNLRLQAPAIAYRSFRMKSLYAPPGT